MHAGILLVLGSWAPLFAQESPTSAPSLFPTNLASLPAFKVVRPGEGNRLVILNDGRPLTVRLAGVDLPSDNEPYALETRAFVGNLLRGETVHLESARSGAKIADGAEVYVFRAPDGLFVNLELVRQGYGTTTPAIADPYAPAFRRFQAAAVENERGIWGPAAGKRPAPRADASAGASKSNPADASHRVCVTASGKKYHKPDCQFVAGRPTTVMTIAEARQKGYTPCSQCDPR